MEEHKRKMISDITLRVKVLYVIFTLVAIVVFVRIGCVQFASRDTAINAEKLRKTIIFKDSIAAHRGAIFARDGKPLAISIFRQAVIFDFGSEGFDNRERFEDEADSLSKLLAARFRDRSAKDYYKTMIAERDRCFRLVNGRDSVVRNGDGFVAQFIARMRGKPTRTIRIYDTVRKHSHTRLFRDIDINEWQELKEYPILNESLGRVYTIEKNDTRVYPQNDIALRLIGRSGQQGSYGIEYAYRKELAGENGYEWLQCIAPRCYGRVDGAEHKEPIDGMDVVTTLDVEIQDVADKVLRQQLADEHAIWGTSIVMECTTGDILAMVNLGRNSKGEFVENLNYALGARLEPGSTFKLAASLALIEDKDFTLDRIYDSGHGKRVPVGRFNKIQDSHNIGGNIDMLTAFAQSANVWFAKAVYTSYENEPQRYVDFLRSLHLDRTVGLESFGEATPTMPDYKTKYKWNGQTLANMGYGYGVELAPIQTLTLYNAVANGGRMVAPRLVTRIMRGSRTVEEFPTRVLVERICDDNTLDAVRRCLEEVASTGTAKAYFGDKATAYRVGAKTGTATVAQGNKKGKIAYKDGYYLGSMVTYLPADKPKYTVMTAIFKKKGSGGTTVYGAGLAGPVQQKICTYLYNRHTNPAESGMTDGVQYHPTDIKGGDISKIRRVASRLSQRVQTNARTGWGVAKAGSDGSVAVSPVATANNTMPDVCGMGLSDALFLLENRGLKVDFAGSGKVVEQIPEAGTGVKRGNRVTIKLE